jgi:hypothetical protein
MNFAYKNKQGPASPEATKGHHSYSLKLVCESTFVDTWKADVPA